MKMSKGLRVWRSEQPHGSIMEPETFEKIRRKAKRKYGSDDIAERAAGAAYWQTARKKYRERT